MKVEGRPHYKSYSGDQQPFDIRIRKNRIDFQPDVIWERGGETCVFELAFEEDWRAIVGEITLAGLSGKIDKIFIITDYEDLKISRVVKMLDNEYKKLKWLKHGADHIVVAGNITDAKRAIKKVLVKKEWI